MIEPIVEKKSKWGKVGKVVVIFVVFLIVAFAGFYQWTGIPSASASYAKNKQLAEQEGLAFTQADYDKQFAFAPEDNAASILAANPPPSVSLLSDGSPGTGFETKRDEIIATFPKLQEVRQRKLILNPVDLSNTKLSEDKVHARQWVEFLVYFAAEKAKAHDLVTTTKYYQLAVFLANHAGDDRTFWGFRRRIGCTGIVLKGLRQLLPAASRQQEWLDMIAKQAWALDVPFQMKPVLSTEHARQLLTFDQIQEKNLWWEFFGMDDALNPAFRFGPRLPRFREASLSYIHGYFTKASHELSSDPWNFDANERAFRSAEPILQKDSWDAEYAAYEVVLRTLSVRSIRSISSYKNAVLQAVTILQRNLDPAKGLPLPGRYRLDVDGNPIRIKKFPKGWEVYSIGADGKDDGGLDTVDGSHDVIVHLSMGTVPVKPKPKPAPKATSGAPPGSPAPAPSTGDD